MKRVAAKKGTITFSIYKMANAANSSLTSFFYETIKALVGRHRLLCVSFFLSKINFSLQGIYLNRKGVRKK